MSLSRSIALMWARSKPEGHSQTGNVTEDRFVPRRSESPPFILPPYGCDLGSRNESSERHQYETYESETISTPPAREADIGHRGSRPPTREADGNHRTSRSSTQEVDIINMSSHPGIPWREENHRIDSRDVKIIKDLEARLEKLDKLVERSKADQEQLKTERDTWRKRAETNETRYGKAAKDRDEYQKKYEALVPKYNKAIKDRDEWQKKFTDKSNKAVREKTEAYRAQCNQMLKERDEAHRKEIDIWRKDMDELRQENKAAKEKTEAYHTQYNQMLKERDEWQRKFDEKNNKAVREKTEAYRAQCNQMLKERGEIHRKEIDIWRKDMDELRKQGETYHKFWKDLEGKQTDLVKNYDEAQATIEKQKANITELTVSISRSVNTSGITTRDDDYFELEFASLAGAIHQWVIRCFRGISVVKYKDLPQKLLDSLGVNLPGYNVLPDSILNLKQVEAVFAERLCNNIFHPNFLFTIQGKLYDFDHICGPLSGTDLKKREWYAQTVGMFFANDQYDDHLRHNTSCVEKDLQEFSGFLAKGENEEQRHKSLPAIIEQAVNLQKETFRQVSLFQLHQIMPGDPYDPFIMEDSSGIVDDEDDEDEDESEDDGDKDGDEEMKDRKEEKQKEKGAKSFIVRTTLFSPVFRWAFDDNGVFLKTPVVVRKGTVIAIRGGD